MLKNLRDVVQKKPFAKRSLAYLLYRREAIAWAFGSGSRLSGAPLVFTIQKCASLYLKKAISIVGHYYGLKSYDYEGFYWNTSDIDTGNGLIADAARLFNHQNAIYGPLREFIPVPNLATRPIVLLLRDPRDVVVSVYYSRAYSHSLPGGAGSRAAFLKMRHDAHTMTVDEFAIFALNEYLPKYWAYAERLLPMPNVTCLSYENMRSDLEDWLDRFLHALGLSPREDVTEELRLAYARDNPLDNGFEDVFKHRRQQEPGDYLRKLSPITIDRLNLAVEPLIKKYGLWKL